MARQYGAPKEVPGQPPKNNAYGASRKDPAPTVKREDPSPPNRVVSEFHKNASVDSRKEDIHHTVGPGSAQAASGTHRHNGSDSPLLLEGMIITGNKTTAPASVLASIILVLKKLGATDSTT